ncbi:MAG: helix-turn-helix transcriptional regulator [Candidatus Eremiobacteraeota bacterium]|nr:helix-turn-helix transcriptional regulator [Candidatus Eremiobacteraeota bacterium]
MRTAELVHGARVALRTGRYDDALALLEGCEDWTGAEAERAALIKAETLGRRDPAEALSYLLSVDDIFVSDDGRFGRDLEAGRFHAVSRDFDAADARYAEAAGLADHVENGAATLAYHQLRMRWFRRDCNPEAPEIAVALTHPDPSIKAASYAYRAWLHAGAGDYAMQIADFAAALSCEAVDDLPIDVATLAMTTHALARVAFETADALGVAAAQQAHDAIDWPDAMQSERFGTLRAIGWDAFMRGEAARAQWTFKDAKAIAPSPAWQTMAHLDRAYVARIANNEPWAIEELDEADRLARRVPWESTFGEERQALVMLATLYARVDPIRAQRYAATYSRIGVENVNPALAIAGDRRTIAMAKYAKGLIDLTTGRKEAAIPALREAYGIYRDANHHYRATLAAAALAEATGEAHWAETSRSHAARYPNSPLATVAQDAIASEEAMPKELTAFQRQLARAAIAGVDSAELSRRFSRSLYTIEKQLAAVFHAFGATSRHELIAEARRRGLR